MRYVRFGKDSTIKWERTLPVSDSSQDAWKEMVVKDDVSEDGYAVAYLVSEGGAPFLVDDFSVTAYSSRLVAIRGYYPYGMAYGSQGTVAQTNEATGTWGDWTSADADMAPGLPGYTGQPEVEEEWWGHPFSNFGYRYYDPRIGRWHTVDPANQFSSPYDFTGGMPMERVDPDGRFAVLTAVLVGAAIGAVVGAYAGGAIANNGELNPWDWSNSKNTWKGVALGAGIGAVVGAGIGFASTGNAGLVALTGKQGSYSALGNALSQNFGYVAHQYGGAYGTATTTVGWGGLSAKAAATTIAATGVAPTFAAAAAPVALAALGSAAVASAVLATQGSGLSLDRPDVDGIVTWKEAFNWWHAGNGQDLWVNVATMGELLGRKSYKKWKNKLPWPMVDPNFFDFFKDKVSNLSMIYGSIGFKRKDKDVNMINDYDVYDFNIRPDWNENFKRNSATLAGKIFHGPGKPFKIKFYGKYKP